jgi:hypothetical protein
MCLWECYDPGGGNGESVIGPHGYFTFERIIARTPKVLPPVLFHFTRPERAINILRDGYIKGHPTVSTTENPAIAGPGPIAFVLAPSRIRKMGYQLWPCIWGRGYEREAEWIVVSDDAERYEAGEVSSCTVRSGKVLIPMEAVYLIGYPQSWPGKRGERFHGDIRAIRSAARHYGIPVRQFSWDEWWSEEGVRPRRSR